MSIESTSKRSHAPIILSLLAPSMLIIFLFVYLPLIFAFIMSLYENPSILVFENLFAYYLNRKNMYWIKVRDLAANLWDKDFFFIFGAVGIIIGSFLGVNFAKRLGVKNETTQVLSSLYFNVLIASPVVLITKIIFINLPAFVKLPVKNYNDVLVKQTIVTDFTRILFNTVFWTITCTFFHIVLGLGLAILLNEDFKGRGVLRSIFILPWAIPSYISALIWKNYIFNSENGVLGKWAVKHIPVGSLYYVTLADILATIVIFFVLIGFIVFAKNKFGGSPITVFMSFAAFIISTFIIVLVFQSNTTRLPILGKAVITISDTKETFWFNSNFYFFNIQLKMIFIAAILTNIWLGIPFMMVSFLAALQAIPDDLYEAATIDGASGWGQFTAITFPMVKPTLRTVALLGIIWTFNLFNVFYILTDKVNISADRKYYDIFITYIYNLFYPRAGVQQFAYAAALSFIVFLLLVGFSRAYQLIFAEEEE